MGEGTIKVLDLFAGCGGLSLGFDLVRNNGKGRVYEVVKAVEIDHDACDTLRKYFRREYGRNDVVLEGDLTRADIRRQIVDELRGKISIIVGGPPCQSFSMLGPRSGYGVGNRKFRNDRRDRLYKEYLKIVRELNPAFIVFENVKGILTKRDPGGRRYIDAVVHDFKRLGYTFSSSNPDVTDDFLVLNAADYGVPQTRERVFLIGNNLAVSNPFPEKTHEDPRMISGTSLLPWTTLRDAIGDLPRLKAKYTHTDLAESRIPEIRKLNERRWPGDQELSFDEERFAEHFARLGVSGQELLRFVRNGANGTLLYHEARPQKAADIRLFAGMRQGTTAKTLFTSRSAEMKRLRNLIKYRMKDENDEFTFGDKYRKQSWSRPSTTLFAHLAKDGNRFIHPDGRQARTYTVREAARVQSFPDWYEFCGTSRGSKFRQVGNAVPPLLAMKIAEAIYRTFLRIAKPVVG